MELIVVIVDDVIFSSSNSVVQIVEVQRDFFSRILIIVVSLYSIHHL
ncbi:hypothetical protein HYV86_04810 [Candidatus Woesearchaeota archaeon]|nr:hypothetical protein [Candidatus Woesearchaeota archaeon]